MILYLDCDTGVDDALALAVLLANPRVEIAGIGTVSGNTSADQAATNTLNLLALLGVRRVPLHDPLAAGIAIADLVPDDAPLLGLRVDTGAGEERGRINEDPGAAYPVRVVLSLTRPAGPIIRAQILG